MKKSNLLVAVALAALFSGCNGNQDQQQSSDWVNDPAHPISQTPAPSPTPTPAATVNAADLYTGDAQFEKYVANFVADATLQGLNLAGATLNPKLEIRLQSLAAYGSTTIGLCETSATMRRVTFEPSFWNAVNETQRELLAHHELGHCVLFRPHRTDLLAGGAYASIMYPVIMSSATYNGNLDYYQNELYTYGVSLGAAAAARSGLPQVHVCQ